MAFGIKGVISLDNTGFIKAVRESKQATDKVKTSADGAGSSIKGMLGAAAGFMGLSLSVGHALKTFVDFEKQMSVVGGISGASKKEMETLSDKAMEMGRILPASASDAAVAMTNLARSGFTVNEVMGSIEGTLYLATAAQVDMGTAAQITSGTLRGFGLAASQASHVADVLSKTANTTGTDIQGLGDAMKYIAPVAHSAKQSLEEISGAIGILANNNILASQAGTTLRGAFVRLMKPAKLARNVMADIGFNAYDSQGNMKNLSSIIGDLKNATAGMTQEQKSYSIAQIFGAEALSGMLVLMDAGKDKIDNMTNSLKNSDGQAKKTAEVYTDNIYGALQSIEGAYETLELKMVKQSSPAIQKALNGVADAIPVVGDNMVAVSEILVANKDVIIGMITAYGVYRGLLIAAALFETGLGVAIGIKSGIMTISTVATMAYTSIQQGAAVGTTLLTAAQLLLNAAYLANPIGVVVLAIAALVGGLVWAYHKFDWFKDMIDSVWDSLKGLASVIGGVFGSIGKAVKGTESNPYFAKTTKNILYNKESIGDNGGKVLPWEMSVIPDTQTNTTNTTESNITNDNKFDIKIDARGMNVDQLVDTLKIRLANT